MKPVQLLAAATVLWLASPAHAEDECRFNSDCASGDVCQDGRCYLGAPPKDAECSNSTHCLGDAVCHLGSCVELECSVHTDCALEEDCENGWCVTDTRQDRDRDGVPDGADNCPDVANAGQEDLDRNGGGDACTTDRDGDRIADADDNCPDVHNHDQGDDDADGIGDACDLFLDSDGDGIRNSLDLCPLVKSANRDGDHDGIGDECDLCPQHPSTLNVDTDGDGMGDPCDWDDDDDCVHDMYDNCPAVSNPGQGDYDADGLGDKCDPYPRSPYDDVCLDDRAREERRMRMEALLTWSENLTPGEVAIETLEFGESLDVYGK